MDFSEVVDPGWTGFSDWNLFSAAQVLYNISLANNAGHTDQHSGLTQPCFPEGGFHLNTLVLFLEWSSPLTPLESFFLEGGVLIFGAGVTFE